LEIKGAGQRDNLGHKAFTVLIEFIPDAGGANECGLPSIASKSILKEMARISELLRMGDGTGIMMVEMYISCVEWGRRK